MRKNRVGQSVIYRLSGFPPRKAKTFITYEEHQGIRKLHSQVDNDSIRQLYKLPVKLHSRDPEKICEQRHSNAEVGFIVPHRKASRTAPEDGTKARSGIRG
jgi:hypothetical protein